MLTGTSALQQTPDRDFTCCKSSGRDVCNFCFRSSEDAGRVCLEISIAIKRSISQSVKKAEEAGNYKHTTFMNFVSHQDHGSGTKINTVDLKPEVGVSEMAFYISWKPVRPPVSVGLHKLAATKAWSCITGHMYTQKLQNSEEELTVLQLPNDLKGLNFASISICFALLPTENTQYIFQLQWWLTVLYHFATRSDTTCKRRTTGERNRRDSGSILYRQYLIATMNNSCCKVRATSVTELLA